MKTPHKAFSRRCTAAANAKEKRRRTSASRRGFIQQKECAQQNSRSWEWPPACITERERVRKSREHAKGSSVRERQRISVHPAVLDEPKDHDVTKGRDESLRCEGGHSPEYHTVVLETTDEHQVQRTSQTSQTAAHIVVNYLPVDRGHQPRTINHEAAQC